MTGDPAARPGAPVAQRQTAPYRRHYPHLAAAQLTGPHMARGCAGRDHRRRRDAPWPAQPRLQNRPADRRDRRRRAVHAHHDLAPHRGRYSPSSLLPAKARARYLQVAGAGPVRAGPRGQASWSCSSRVSEVHVANSRAGCGSMPVRPLSIPRRTRRRQMSGFITAARADGSQMSCRRQAVPSGPDDEYVDGDHQDGPERVEREEQETTKTADQCEDDARPPCPGLAEEHADASGHDHDPKDQVRPAPAAEVPVVGVVVRGRRVARQRGEIGLPDRYREPDKEAPAAAENQQPPGQSRQSLGLVATCVRIVCCVRLSAGGRGRSRTLAQMYRS